MIHKQFEMAGIPDRPPKPRESGITLMLDKGLAARQVEDVLEVAAEYIDLVKLGWGTAVITPGLHRKLAIYRSAGVFEAPRKAQQVWFIQQLGTNVNLGNILPEEMVPLETLRLGLRADTLFEFLGAAEGVGRETFPPRPFLRPAFTEISGSESHASSLAGCKPEPG